LDNVSGTVLARPVLVAREILSLGFKVESEGAWRYCEAMAMSETAATPSSDSLVGPVTAFATETVQRWSDKCQQFLDRQRSGILGADPSSEALAGHRTALRLLLTLGRSIYATAAGPDFPDKRLANELEGRLVQLEHSWRMVHEPMARAEAERLLSEVFPNEP
jgi:hypothetical protein